MKLVLFIAFLAFVGVSYGQDLPVISVAQQTRIIAQADWEEMGIGDESGHGYYVDNKTIRRDQAAVFFHARTRTDLSKLYGQIVASCVTGKYVAINVFIELPNGTLVKDAEEDYEILTATKGSLIYAAMVYACNYNPDRDKVILPTRPPID